MSFMERSNWSDPNHRRRIRVFIPIAVGLVIVASVLVAVKSKTKLLAFGGGDCPSPSASASAGMNAQAATRRSARALGRKLPKGAEAVAAGEKPVAEATDEAVGRPDDVHAEQPTGQFATGRATVTP